MLSKYIPYTKIYFFALLLLAVGLSTGKFLMSLSSIILACTWLLEGDFKSKWERIKSYHYAPLILSFGYLLHILGLLNTSNFQFAFHDLMLKLPLFSFPIILGSINPLSKKKYLIVIGVFVIGLFISTLISYGVYIELFPTKSDITDVRNISIFISHIRLSLLICLAIVLAFYYFFNYSLSSKLIVLGLNIWFVYFLYILSGTGILILYLLLGYSLFWILRLRISKFLKVTISLSGILFIMFSFGYVYYSYKDYSTLKETTDLSNLDIKSPYGEPYIHDTTSFITENGYYLWLNIASREVETTWNERSRIPFDSTDLKGQPIMGTLYRYITSKGYRKDKDGVLKLTENDIVEIESGNTSCVKLTSINERLHKIFFEFDSKQNGNNVNGHSITQRLNFSIVGLMILKENILFGVGTGDVPDSFEAKYIQIDSKLKRENRKRAHNQFLTLFITFGIFGFLLWVISFFYPIFLMKKDTMIYGAFLLISMVSFLGDDTLETQAGVTFIAFFNTFFLFHSKNHRA